MKKKCTNIISLLICLVLILPAPVFAGQSTADYSGHWASKQIKSFLELGFIALGKDGNFKPDEPITRAEFAAIANKAFALIEKDPTNFKDVQAKDEFYNDLLIAKKAGYLSGLTDGTVKPKDFMSRQEYAVIISRLLKLDAAQYINEADKYADAAVIPAWSKGAVGAVAKLGYMQGEPGGLFNPKGFVSRGQAVAILERCYLASVKAAYNKAGTYSAGVVEGNAAINAPDVTLENTTINGNLIIGEGVGNGNAKLKNVIVKGDTLVKGGGPNSIIIEDSQIKNIIIIKEDNKVRVVAVGKTTVEKVDMQSGGKLEEQGTTGSGFGYVTIAEGLNSSEPVTLKGSFETVQVMAAGVKLNAEAGSIAKLDVAKTAEAAKINLGTGVKVAELVVQSKAVVTGSGTISKADVAVQGVVITAPTTTITAAAGVNVATNLPGQAPAPSTSTSGGTGSGGGSGNGGRSGNSGGSRDDDRDTTVAVSGVTLNHTTMTLTVGEAAGTLAATVVPANATDKRVIWSSSNTDIATVANGVVTPVAAGTATVTVKTVSGAKTATCTVTVNEPVPVSGIRLNTNTLALRVGEAAERLTATIEPADADNKNVTWSSSNLAVATVADGYVTPVGVGTSTITVTTADGGKTASCVVTVNEKDEETEIDFLSNYVGGFTENTNELRFTVQGELAGPIDTSKLRYITSESGQYGHTLSGSYELVDRTWNLEPGQFGYSSYSSFTTIYIHLIDTDANGIVGLQGYGNTDIEADKLVAEEGWYPNAGTGIKTMESYKEFDIVNNSPITIGGIYYFDENDNRIESRSVNEGYMDHVKVNVRTTNIVFHSGEYAPFSNPTSGKMKTVPFDPAATTEIILDASGWIDVDETNFGPTAPASNPEAVDFLPPYQAELTANVNMLTFRAGGLLTADIDLSKIKYVTSRSGDYYYNLQGDYSRVEPNEMGPGKYWYLEGFDETMIYLVLTEDDADTIKALTDYGSDLDNLYDSNDSLVAEEGWYPGAETGTKGVYINNEIYITNDTGERISGIYQYDDDDEMFQPLQLFLDPGETDKERIREWASNIIFYIGGFTTDEPTSGKMKIVPVNEELITNGIILDESGWIAVDETNFGPAAPEEEPAFTINSFAINYEYSEEDLIYINFYPQGDGDATGIDFNDLIVQVGETIYEGEEGSGVPSPGKFTAAVFEPTMNIGILQIKGEVPFEDGVTVTVTGKNRLSGSGNAQFDTLSLE